MEPKGLEGEDLVALALEAEDAVKAGGAGECVGGEAGEALVIGAEDIGAGAGDADDGVDRGFVGAVRRVAGLVELGGPAGAGTGEEELNGFAGLFVFVGGGEGVEDAAEGFFTAGFWVGEDDDGGFQRRILFFGFVF